MTLQGDLATLELADIVQNLEMHRRSGTLAVETSSGATRVYVQAGAAALLATDTRPALLDDLVLSGLVTAKDVAKAKKARWRTRKPLGEVLVKRKAIDGDTLRWFGESRLREDLCDFLALDAGAFTFTEERIPRSTFDPEERALGLALPLGPLLFEAARRKDHWPLVRRCVPSDAVHHHAPESAEPPPNEDEELGRALLARLDGTRNVREVMRAFPHRRFDAYELLARLIEAQHVRGLGADDLVSLAETLADGDAERAWQVVGDGLAAHGHHVGLLRRRVELATQRRDDKAAAEALKMIAHVQLDAGDREEALDALKRAAELDPKDTSIWERTFQIAQEDERADDALAHGMHLVKLYRGPGLHSRAVGVLEQLEHLAPDSWDVQRELARSRVDAGGTTSAVTGLERHGKKLLARRDYPAARAVQVEILRLVPGRRQAQQTLEQIDAQVFERRRERRKKMARGFLVLLATAALAAEATLDVRARIDRDEVEREIVRGGLLEDRRYDDAIDALEGVRERHPFAFAARFELGRRIADLEARRRGSEPAPTSDVGSSVDAE